MNTFASELATIFSAYFQVKDGIVFLNKQTLEADRRNFYPIVQQIDKKYRLGLYFTHRLHSYLIAQSIMLDPYFHFFASNIYIDQLILLLDPVIKGAEAVPLRQTPLLYYTVWEYLNSTPPFQLTRFVVEPSESDAENNEDDSDDQTKVIPPTHILDAAQHTSKDLAKLMYGLAIITGNGVIYPSKYSFPIQMTISGQRSDDLLSLVDVVIQLPDPIGTYQWAFDTPALERCASSSPIYCLFTDLFTNNQLLIDGKVEYYIDQNTRNILPVVPSPYPYQKLFQYLASKYRRLRNLADLGSAIRPDWVFTLPFPDCLAWSMLYEIMNGAPAYYPIELTSEKLLQHLGTYETFAIDGVVTYTGSFEQFIADWNLIFTWLTYNFPSFKDISIPTVCQRDYEAWQSGIGDIMTELDKLLQFGFCCWDTWDYNLFGTYYEESNEFSINTDVSPESAIDQFLNSLLTCKRVDPAITTITLTLTVLEYGSVVELFFDGDVPRRLPVTRLGEITNALQSLIGQVPCPSMVDALTAAVAQVSIENVIVTFNADEGLISAQNGDVAAFVTEYIPQLLMVLSQNLGACPPGYQLAAISYSTIVNITSDPLNVGSSWDSFVAAMVALINDK